MTDRKKAPNTKVINEQSKLYQKDVAEDGSCTHKHFVKGFIRRESLGLKQGMKCVHCQHTWTVWLPATTPEPTQLRSPSNRPPMHYPVGPQWEGV